MHPSPRDIRRSFHRGLAPTAMPAWAVAAAITLACPWSSAATFAEQKTSVSQSIKNQPETAIIPLLEAGIAESQPAQASALAGDWLKDNLPQSPRLLFLLGRCAELAGDWREAAAFYQQFLKQAGPSSADAADAITATYTLLINQLGDIESAYAFGQREAASLASNPRFRQYDRWFLDLARQRNDLPAVSDRLLATAKSGVPADHIATFHGNDLLWLLAQIGSTHLDEKNNRFDPAFVQNTIALANTLDFDPELKLLLAWKVSVVSYHMARLDGREAEAPATAAKALLEKFPAYAEEVQNDWAGGHNGRHYRGDPNQYWPHQLEQKLPPIQQALAKLDDLAETKLLRTWSSRHYDGGPEMLTTAQSRAMALEQPQRINRRSGPLLAFEWNKLTIDEAKALAPALEYNPSPEASLIRAIASVGGKDYDKLMDQLLGPEVWRLSSNELNSQYPDYLWNWSGNPGGRDKRDQQIRRSKAIADAIPDAKKLASLPADERLGKFRSLWQEYTSPRLRTPGIISQLRTLLGVTPEAVAELLANPSLDARWLAEAMLNTEIRNGEKPMINQFGMRGALSTTRFDPFIERLANANGNLDRLKQDKEKYQPHPLLPAIDKALRQQLKDKSPEPWLVMAWLNARFPEHAAKDSELMTDLLKSPAWSSMPAHVRHAACQTYPQLALTPAQQKLLAASMPETASASLLALDDKTDAAAAIAAVKTATKAILEAPTRVAPAGLEKLALTSDALWTDPSFVAAVVDFIGQTRLTTPDLTLGNRIIAVASQATEAGAIMRLTPYIWTNVESWHRPFAAVMELTSTLANRHPEAASALARAGLHTIARYKTGHTWFKRDTDIPTLKTIRGKTAMQLGLIEIPVAPNDPAYPVYQSQAEWMSDHIDTAWKLLDSHWDTFLAIHRELTLPYTMWALERSIETRDNTRQEQLIRPLLQWASATDGTLRPVEKAAIEIAYGDIAMQLGQIPQALEIFKRIQDREEYRDIPARHQATLRRVRAMRISKDFDGALQVLADLELERAPGLWIDTRFARAEVHFDMEEYDEAQDDINAILNHEPTHPDARILLGKVQLKRQKLMEATEVELGSTTSQQTLVPGETLKVTLSDPTLAVSGAGTEIEVVVWTTTGDREQFFLRQFGDQKTKFRGEVATALGAPAPDDGTLQVIGNDEVFYAYSDRFLQKMNQLENKRGGPIRIASDALLMASARKLLNEAEQRRADMQAVMEEISASHSNAAAAARAEFARQATDSKRDDNPLERYLTQVAKPGNPIHIRVIDPDRSRTPDIDELNVSVATSSGDSISRVTLRETGTHTGWFEGSVATTSASAVAIARNSEPGRNPNMVISSNPDYPAWRPTPVKDHVPEFTIDLNDRIDLGDMTVTASEPGFALRKFIVQTAATPGDWTTVASQPPAKVLPPDPWLPSVTVVNETPRHAHYGARPVTELAGLREHLQTGWIQQPEMAIAKNVAGPSQAFPASIPTDVAWKRQGRWDNPAVVYRFKAYFHESTETERHFQLKLGKHQPQKSDIKADAKQLKEPARFLLTIDGRPLGNPGDPEIAGSINLSPGVHTLELWATGWLSNIGFGREASLVTRTSEQAPWESCDDSFFNPQQFPTDSLDQRNRPATITAAADGTSFNVRFAKDSSTRLIRLLITEQEGPVPSLGKIALTNADGGRVLPLADDFAQLNKNDTLEILTGDRISVRYQDDRFVTEEKQRQERFLKVSFTDARIEFADTAPRFDSAKNKMVPYYEKLLRFAHGKPVNLVIQDADMDSTVNPDTINVTLASKTGGTATYSATETGDSTGVFILTVTPVITRPATDGEFQVAAGDTLTASYRDEENNRPAVATERHTSIAHAAFSEPDFIVGHATVSPCQPEPGTNATTTLRHGFDPIYQQPGADDPRQTAELIRPRWQIENTLLPSTKAPDGGFQAVLGQPLYLELLAPQYALGEASTVTVYAQTDSGRQTANTGANPSFDITAPGTIKLTGSLSPRAGDQHGWFNAPTLASYRNHTPWPPTAAISTERFRISIPIIAGVLPAHGVLSEAEIEEMTTMNADTRDAAKDLLARSHSLVAKPGERIHIGFQFTGPDGTNRWLTTSTRVTTQPAFDIMDEAYRSSVTAAYAGESLHLRVVDLGADTSDDIDQVRVLMQAKSGAKHHVTLRESGPHTGIFRDSVLLSHTRNPETTTPEHDVASDGFPVTYGDTVAARYTDANGLSTETLQVSISKGADGTIAPFSKIYQDEEIAMRTQFSLAEAYLEMAKRHRQLGQTEQADREYASAKLLLSKAMDQFTDPDTRANAEYLLGMLTMEEALTTEAGELRETRFRAALSRFMNVTGSYSLSLHASRAQYRIASIYEELNEPEIAAQEYVKLAYKYPESEFLATAMAKLGTHFLKKASALEQQAKPLLARADEDKDAAYEGEALQKLAQDEYLKTASIFSRLLQRFPGNRLSGPAGLSAGQAYMRAKHHREAIDMFNIVIAESSYDGPEVRAQAMYWAGMCHQQTRAEMAAYSMFKRLTYDFPESKWAAYARAQLSEDRLLKLENRLELERLEAGQ